MPIDASIYANVQPIQTNMPSPLDYAGKAMALSQAAIQQAQLQRQMQGQMAVKQAFSDNMDQNGNLDQQGFLSDLAKTNPAAAVDYKNQFIDQSKKQAEAQAAQVDTAQKTLSYTIPYMHYLAGLPEDQRADAYPVAMKQLASAGVDTSKMPSQYDPQMFRQTYSMVDQVGSQMKDFLANQAAQEGIKKTQAETQGVQATTQETQAKTAESLANTASIPLKNQEIVSTINKNNNEMLGKGADELDKFKNDIVNASSRQTTGALINARDRADRVMSLLNAGATPNETTQQRIARLNNLMPQIGTEVSTSLAAIMQGGVPDENMTKELSPETIQSKLATLQQKFTASPTAANQGELLQAYGDVAKKLRDFSADRLQQDTQRIRAAYPYAEKYFPDKMNQIAAPMESPGLGAQQSSSSAQASKSSNASSASAQGGTIKMMSPSGKIKLVPLSMKGEAIAAGGKVVQ